MVEFDMELKVKVDKLCSSYLSDETLKQLVASSYPKHFKALVMGEWPKDADHKMDVLGYAAQLIDQKFKFVGSPQKPVSKLATGGLVSDWQAMQAKIADTAAKLAAESVYSTAEFEKILASNKHEPTAPGVVQLHGQGSIYGVSPTGRILPDRIRTKDIGCFATFRRLGLNLNAYEHAEMRRRRVDNARFMKQNPL